MVKITKKECERFLFHKINKNMHVLIKYFVRSLVWCHSRQIQNFVTLWELIRTSQNLVLRFFSLLSLKLCNKIAQPIKLMDPLVMRSFWITWQVKHTICKRLNTNVQVISVLFKFETYQVNWGIPKYVYPVSWYNNKNSLTLKRLGGRTFNLTLPSVFFTDLFFIERMKLCFFATFNTIHKSSLSWKSH